MAIVSRFWMMSLQAGILILVVLLARMFLKKYPKIYTYCLWILVGLRLLCPIFIETPFSLQPDYTKLSDKVQEQAMQGSMGGTSQDLQFDVTDIQQGTGESVKPEPPVNLFPNEAQGGQQSVQQSVQNTMSNGNATTVVIPDATKEHISITRILEIIAVVYVAGIGVVACFYLTQYLVIRRRISTAVRERGNVWLCENISSPFVIGIFNPRIILPYTLSEKEKQHILRHERTHIRHHDPFIRLVGLVCLCMHWWNPLVWLAVHKMNQDMEMFCDETALKESTTEERKSYARTLLSFAEKQSGFSVGLAFGESNTERRVKNIMNKRKGSIIIVSVIAVLIIFCMVAFMTIPKDADKNNSTVNNENTQETSDDGKSEEKNRTDNTGETTSGIIEQPTKPSTEQQSAEFRSIDAQLELIAENISMWKIIPDYANENVSYAITDLDQNGRLEVIVSNMGGTGIYTYSRFYEVNEQYDGLLECATGFVEGSSQPDIIVEDVDMYYDATENIFYYIETDLIKVGPVEYNTFTNAMCLNGGKIVTTTLSHMIETYPEYKVVYKDGAGEEITEREYKELVAHIFEGCDKYGANFGWQDVSELEASTDKEAIVNLLVQSYDRFGFYVDYEEGLKNVTDKAAYKAYAEVLENLYYNHEFPGGENLGIQPDDADASLNQFAVLDIDSDGRDELIVGYTTTYTAGMTVKVYDFNSEAGTVREQFSEFPSLTFYDNGVIIADWSHNHGRAPMSEDFWPYRMYLYDELADKYVEVAIVDAWDDEYYNQDGSFPKEADIDGDGILYYIMPNKEVEYNTPFDGTEYNEWLNFYLGGAEKVTVSYMNMSLENIAGLEQMAE